MMFKEKLKQVVSHINPSENFNNKTIEYLKGKKEEINLNKKSNCRSGRFLMYGSMAASLMIIITAIVINIVLVPPSKSISESTNDQRFNQLKEDYEKTTIASEKVNISKVGNKELINDGSIIKEFNEINGFDSEGINEDQFIEKDLITYKEAINNLTKLEYDPSISADRLVWAVIVKFPNGYQHPRGFVKNAIFEAVWDAETGESFGHAIYSLDPNGNGISKK